MGGKVLLLGRLRFLDFERGVLGLPRFLDFDRGGFGMSRFLDFDRGLLKVEVETKIGKRITGHGWTVA
jgi:hypothetical protein